MIIYSVIFLIIFLSTVVAFRVNQRSTAPILLFFCALLMTSLAGLRAETVSRDYINYRDFYNFSPNSLGLGFLTERGNSLPTVDIGYVYMNSIFKYIGISFEVSILLIACFSVLSYAIIFNKNLKYPLLALLLYYSHHFFNREMTQIRAGIACAILLWSFYLVSKKEFKSALLLYIAAVSFHITATMAIIPIVASIYDWRPSIKFIGIGLGLSMIIGVYIDSSFPLFSLLDRLAVYQDSEFSVSIGILSNPVTLKQLILVIISMALMTSYKESIFSKYYWVCFIAYIFSTFWIIAFNQFQALGARGATFLSIGEPIIIAEIVSICYTNSKLNQYKKLSVIGALSIASVMFILNILSLIHI